jgi:hypothetical protein
MLEPANAAHDLADGRITGCEYEACRIVPIAGIATGLSGTASCCALPPRVVISMAPPKPMRKNSMATLMEALLRGITSCSSGSAARKDLPGMTSFRLHFWERRLR